MRSEEDQERSGKRKSWCARACTSGNHFKDLFLLDTFFCLGAEPRAQRKRGCARDEVARERERVCERTAQVCSSSSGVRQKGSTMCTPAVVSSPSSPRSEHSVSREWRVRIDEGLLPAAAPKKIEKGRLY